MTYTKEVVITRDLHHTWKNGIRLGQRKPTKIRLDFPDRLEMDDENGNTHVYSITQILDGLKALAHNKESKDL